MLERPLTSSPDKSPSSTMGMNLPEAALLNRKRGTYFFAKNINVNKLKPI